MTVNGAKRTTPTESHEKDNEQLHLPDLKIQGFRGLEDVEIERLGRVTMITGKNSVGKTSILEAVKIFAARGSYEALRGLLRKREEFVDIVDEEGEVGDEIGLEGLFSGWRINSDSTIVIGSLSRSNQLKIEVADATDEQLEFFGRANPGVFEAVDKTISATFNESSYNLPWVFSSDHFSTTMSFRYDRRNYRYAGARLPRQRFQPGIAEIPCATFGPGLPPNNELAKTWDNVVLTDDEERSLDALKLILGDDIVRVVVRGDQRGRYRNGRRFIVARSDLKRQLPLKSFGDGALRMLGVALALVDSRNGFLLMDEAENGIHYSVQPDFWRMVLNTAQENNVQVIATTHSYDCVRSFAQAAVENPEVKGELVRLNVYDGKLHADLYSEEEVEEASSFSVDLR